MTSKNILFGIMFFLYSILSAQSREHLISGSVKESKSGQPLINCNVFIKDSYYGTVTDKNGRFQLKLSDGTYTLVVSYVGYTKQERTISIRPSSNKEFSFSLEPKVFDEREIEITAEKEEPSTINQKIQAEDIQMMPTVYSDVLRSVQVLAGVSTNNELSSGYNVRGGTYDENLIYLNGYEIYRPFLLRMGYEESQTLVNQDMVKNLTFYNGAFPASYGDRMSSALQIDYSKNKTGQIKGTVHASFLNMGANLSNSHGKFNYNFGFRYAYPSAFLGGLQTKGDYKPSYSDFQILASYDLTNSSELEFMGIYGENKITVEPSRWDGAFGFKNRGDYRGVSIEYEGDRYYNQATHLFGVRYINKLAPGSSMIFSVAKYYTKESETYDLEGDIFYVPNAMTPDLDREYLKTRFEDGDNFVNLDSYRFKAGLKLKMENHLISFGTEYRIADINSRLKESLLEEGDSLLYEVPVSENSSKTYDMNSFSFFVQDDIQISKELNASIGARLLNYEYSGELLISPRAIIYYRPSLVHTFSFSWGYYYQPPFINELRNTQIDNLKSQRSIHYLAGWEYYFKENVKFKAEAYYKDYDNLIPFYYDGFKMTYTESNNREGYAYGLDLMVEGNISQRMRSWFGYSYLNTQERKKGTTEFQRRLLDQTHTIQIFLQDRMPKHPNWQSHLRFLAGSGYLYYNRTIVDDPNTGDSYMAVNSTNPEEFMFFLRVDMGLSASFDVGSGNKLVGVVEVLNVFNRYNPGAYEWAQVFKDIKYPIKIPHILSRRFFNVRFEFRF